MPLFPMTPPPVLDAVDRATFVEHYLVPGRPLVVRGALRGWRRPPPWHLTDLRDRFGHHRVLLYDTLFSPLGLSTFGAYLDRCSALGEGDGDRGGDARRRRAEGGDDGLGSAGLGDGAAGDPGGGDGGDGDRRGAAGGPGDGGVAGGREMPYLRWYARQQADRLPWADRAFAELAGDWAAPGWLPDGGYVLPRRPVGADPTRQPFPAKGLFVCGRGGRTRLHVDPWASDACLCQVTGEKRFVLYSPATAAAAAGAGGDERDARWRALTPDLDEVLVPGDAVYVPAGWHHWAEALSDSVSITWNFVHRAHAERFARHVAATGHDPVLHWFAALDDGEPGAGRPRADRHLPEPRH